MTCILHIALDVCPSANRRSDALDPRLVARVDPPRSEWPDAAGIAALHIAARHEQADGQAAARHEQVDGQAAARHKQADAQGAARHEQAEGQAAARREQAGAKNALACHSVGLLGARPRGLAVAAAMTLWDEAAAAGDPWARTNQLLWLVAAGRAWPGVGSTVLLGELATWRVRAVNFARLDEARAHPPAASDISDILGPLVQRRPVAWFTLGLCDRQTFERFVLARLEAASPTADGGWSVLNAQLMRFVGVAGGPQEADDSPRDDLDSDADGDADDEHDAVVKLTIRRGDPNCPSRIHSQRAARFYAWAETASLDRAARQAASAVLLQLLARCACRVADDTARGSVLVASALSEHGSHVTRTAMWVALQQRAAAAEARDTVKGGDDAAGDPRKTARDPAAKPLAEVREALSTECVRRQAGRVPIVVGVRDVRWVMDPAAVDHVAVDYEDDASARAAEQMLKQMGSARHARVRVYACSDSEVLTHALARSRVETLDLQLHAHAWLQGMHLLPMLGALRRVHTLALYVDEAPDRGPGFDKSLVDALRACSHIRSLRVGAIDSFACDSPLVRALCDMQCEPAGPRFHTLHLALGVGEDEVVKAVELRLALGVGASEAEVAAAAEVDAEAKAPKRGGAARPPRASKSASGDLGRRAWWRALERPAAVTGRSPPRVLVHLRRVGRCSPVHGARANAVARALGCSHVEFSDMQTLAVCAQLVGDPEVAELSANYCSLTVPLARDLACALARRTGLGRPLARLSIEVGPKAHHVELVVAVLTGALAVRHLSVTVRGHGHGAALHTALEAACTAGRLRNEHVQVLDFSEGLWPGDQTQMLAASACARLERMGWASVPGRMRDPHVRDALVRTIAMKPRLHTVVIEDCVSERIYSLVYERQARRIAARGKAHVRQQVEGETQAFAWACAKAVAGDGRPLAPSAAALAGLVAARLHADREPTVRDALATVLGSALDNPDRDRLLERPPGSMVVVPYTCVCSDVDADEVDDREHATKSAQRWRAQPQPVARRDWMDRAAITQSWIAAIGHRALARALAPTLAATPALARNAHATPTR